MHLHELPILNLWRIYLDTPENIWSHFFLELLNFKNQNLFHDCFLLKSTQNQVPQVKLTFTPCPFFFWGHTGLSRLTGTWVFPFWASLVPVSLSPRH